MKRSPLCVVLLVVYATFLSAQAKGGAEKVFMPKYSAEEAHENSIYGIKVGMTTPEVLDRLGGRMPDKREDKNGEIIVYWKTEEGILQVRFRQENYVSFLGLQFRPPLPTNDFYLLKLPTWGHISDITVPDERLRRDYQLTETDDQHRAVWRRSAKMDGGFEVEISFLSTDERQAGKNFYYQRVEFKYVMVPPLKVKQFDQWAQQQSGKK